MSKINNLLRIVEVKKNLFFIFCLFLLSCDQKVTAPIENNANSYSGTIQNNDSIRKLQAYENFEKASYEVFKNKETVNILAVKYNLPSNHLNDILVSYTELVKIIDLNSDSNKHTEHIKNYAFELGMEEEVFADLLLEYLRSICNKQN